MPVRVEQTPDLAPGRARLRGQALDSLPVEGAEIRIARMDLGSPRFLDPRFSDEKAWGAAECWFQPERGAIGPGLTLGPWATWHLKPHMPYLISFRDAEGSVVDDRMSWPVIRLPSDAPPPSQAQTVSTESPATAEPAAEPEPAEENPLEEFAEMAAQAEEAEAEPPESGTDTDEEKATGGRKGLLAALLGILLVVVVGAVLAFYEPGFLLDKTSVTEAKPPAPGSGPALTLEGSREYLRGRPSADDAALQANRFGEAEQDEAAFLLNSYAARGGNAEAALRLGDLYNPASWTEGVLKAPDAERAAEFYRKAAEAGVAEAMEKLGVLLKSGRVSLDDAPEQAAFWLRKAEEAMKNIGKGTE
jgi:hypothetical protein